MLSIWYGILFGILKRIEYIKWIKGEMPTMLK